MISAHCRSPLVIEWRAICETVVTDFFHSCLTGPRGLAETPPHHPANATEWTRKNGASAVDNLTFPRTSIRQNAMCSVFFFDWWRLADRSARPAERAIHQHGNRRWWQNGCPQEPPKAGQNRRQNTVSRAALKVVICDCGAVWPGISASTC